MNKLGFVQKNLINELLHEPGLVNHVQSLAPEQLHQLITEIGLEDCGELVCIATSHQLQEVFDVDLWHNVLPAQEETFDAARFALWLEILLDGGEELLVSKLLEMESALLLLGLAQGLFVITTLELESCFQVEDEYSRQLDVFLDSCLYEELYEYQIFSRDPQSWDVLLSALVALDKHDHYFLRDILEKLTAMSNEQMDEDDLYTMLTELESIAEDAADNRSRRRGAKGFVNSQDATAFLGLAFLSTESEILSSPGSDAITTAYFRTFSRTGGGKTNSAMPAGKTDPHSNPVMEILVRHSGRKDGIETPFLLSGNILSHQTMLLLGIKQLEQKDVNLYQRRMSELAYLANIIVAGCTVNARRVRAVEASMAASATVALGIELQSVAVSAKMSMIHVQRLLESVSLEKLFLLAWKRLNDTATNQFPYLSCSDDDQRRERIRFCDCVNDLHGLRR